MADSLINLQPKIKIDPWNFTVTSKTTAQKRLNYKIDTGSKFKMAAAAILKFAITSITRLLAIGRSRGKFDNTIQLSYTILSVSFQLSNFLYKR